MTQRNEKFDDIQKKEKKNETKHIVRSVNIETFSLMGSITFGRRQMIEKHIKRRA